MNKKTLKIIIAVVVIALLAVLAIRVLNNKEKANPEAVASTANPSIEASMGVEDSIEGLE